MTYNFELEREERFDGYTNFFYNDGVWVLINEYFMIWEYQENYDDKTYHTGGFVTDDDYGTVVVDYDGIFELPRHVIDALERIGYDCSEIIEPTVEEEPKESETAVLLRLKDAANDICYELWKLHNIIFGSAKDDVASLAMDADQLSCGIGQMITHFQAEKGNTK